MRNFLEISLPFLDNAGEWDAFVERGDSSPALRVTTISITSLQLLTVLTSFSPRPASTSLINKDFMRGARLITLNETNPWHYDTEVFSSCDIALQDGSSLPGLSGKTKLIIFFLTSLAKF
jgi:hypothetical protein